MLRDIAPKATEGTIGKARRLRGAMMLPEALLWRALRERPGGVKFRRQYPAGFYILDFYCADARLVIEIDGEAYPRGDRPARDAARDAWLMNAGIETLRFPAENVLRDLECVARGILVAAHARLPSTIRQCRMVPHPEPSSGRIFREALPLTSGTARRLPSPGSAH
jgi:very-short-patch-repair endonuclease